ncbi:hypothetical protein [Micromonospora rhizosphaerae]|uniref:hypothetical protein n=1 Tax=Micromonospora rhizosphaerae TaxID=568872 RepID=UPI000B8A56A3|nr:hypothetical protein [Micromonospora rhizosphaerae]
MTTVVSSMAERVRQGVVGEVGLFDGPYGVLEVNACRRRRSDAALVGCQELCRELAASGSGTLAE